ncbi:3-keto-5-aminohexanoate cleavage protein [Methylobacterium mesophilicum]|uniref:3-keto-5-aminohexanoate cleavage protein n=1 Tax=Methylobacterium mesophilicum TaxID=39956 RepID=UPI002F2E7962
MAGSRSDTPVVIAVAITGSVPRKTDNPAVPVTVPEQIESTQQAFEAGATLCHIHVRNDDESPSSDPDKFAAVQAGLRRHCPGMIVQFSTGGRGRDPAARGLSLKHRPDMASLSTGSVNFPTIVYENSASLVTDLAGQMKQYGVRPEIEIFDLSHLHGAKRLVEAGLIDARPHVQFVLGVQNAMPAEEHLLDILLAETRRILPEATWTAAGIGRNQATVMDWALARGADAVRTGLEDNIRVTKDRLAASNAELVGLAAAAVARHGRRVATPALGLG